MFDLLCLPSATRNRAGGARRRGWRWAGPAIAAAGLALFAVDGAAAADARLLRLQCSNAVSGAKLPIVVDLDRGRVDSQAATITDTWITWPDPKQGVWEFERATGKLKFRNASSTGGYFLYFSCRTE